MSEVNIPRMWEAKLIDNRWQVLDKEGELIAALADIDDAEMITKQIAASSYMLEALKGVSELIGDEALPDNGELSGAAVCDMVRNAITFITA